MSEHLVIDRWREVAPEIKKLAKDYDLELLAMEQPSTDSEKMEAAMQAAVEIGIPVINQKLSQNDCCVVEPVKLLTSERILELRKVLDKVVVAEPLRDYAVRLVLSTHPDTEFATDDVRKYIRWGASPRAAQSRFNGTQADAGDFGNLSIIVPLHVGQHQDHTLVRR